MAAITLEKRLDRALENVYIDVVLIREGRALGAVGERLAFAAANLAEARDIQKKIEKRDARKARSVL